MEESLKDFEREHYEFVTSYGEIENRIKGRLQNERGSIAQEWLRIGVSDYVTTVESVVRFMYKKFGEFLPEEEDPLSTPNLARNPFFGTPPHIENLATQEAQHEYRRIWEIYSRHKPRFSQIPGKIRDEINSIRQKIYSDRKKNT